MSDSFDTPTDDSTGITGRQVAAAIVGILLLVFVLTNNESTQVSLFLVSVRMPLWLALGGTALVGVAIGMLLGSRRARARSRG